MPNYVTMHKYPCSVGIATNPPSPLHTHTAQVIRSLKHAMQSAVTGATVSFDLPPGYRARPAPAVVPPIFTGERTIIYAVLESGSEAATCGGKATVTLQGELQGETIKHTLEVQLNTLAERGECHFSVPTIHHLTGKALIRDLLLEEGPWGRDVKEEVVKLSRECSVISKHTAFIAIDEEQKEPVKGSLQTWDVVATHHVKHLRCLPKSVAIRACQESAPDIDQMEDVQCLVDQASEEQWQMSSRSFRRNSSRSAQPEWDHYCAGEQDSASFRLMSE